MLSQAMMSQSSDSPPFDLEVSAATADFDKIADPEAGWLGMINRVTGTTHHVSNATQSVARRTAAKSKAIASSISTHTSEAGQAVFSSLESGTNQAGKAIATTLQGTQKTSQAIAQSIGNGTTQAGKAIANTVSNATESAGQMLGRINSSASLQKLTKAIKVDWLVNIIDTVNLDQVEREVATLRRKYPDATPYQLACRVMATKAIYVGGSGLASSLVPGLASAMVAVDLAATTAIQAEMGYQIAAIYGLDVRDPARKGEILAIFGLALGGNHVLKTGFQYLARNVPVAGVVVGASTNAVALYAVGHAACQFYESHCYANLSDASQSASESLPPALAATQAKQDEYFQDAIAQQILMDQILAHVLMAGHPDKSWAELLPMLQELHFSPVSLQLIERHLNEPIEIETLLSQVNPEFAIPLLAQCQKLAIADGVTTPEEAALLELITQTLNAGE